MSSADSQLGHIWTKAKDILVFYVNGKKVVEDHGEPETSLLSYLRTKLRLTGTKLGCGEGGCGACTVMVSKWDPKENAVVHYSVNSCLAPVVSMHGCAVTTVEGIGSTKTKLHAVQERLAKFHGSQCGFCTPGIVMSMYALLRNRPIPTSEDIEMCLQGNLCRCTGYRPILSAFNTFTNSNSGCPMGSECCRSKSGNAAMCNGLNGEVHLNPHSATDVCFACYDPTQEPIFPPELKIKCKKEMLQKPLKFAGERVTWYRPVTMSQLTDLKEKFPDAHLVVGNTEIGIETWVKGQHYPVIVTPAHVEEMSHITFDDQGVTIGASCTLTQIQKEFKKIIEEKSDNLTQPLKSILEMLFWFAGDQIRNVAVLGGNVMTASPISDLNPILMACESKATFMLHSRGERVVTMDQAFFPRYRTTSALKGEVLTSVRLPFTGKDEYMRAYMQSKRREDDIAIVNTAMKVRFHPGTRIVQKFVAAFGGMAATSVMPKNTMKNMSNREWNAELLEDAIKWIGEDLPLELDAPGGMVKYREALAASFFFKFFIYVKDRLVKDGIIKDSITSIEQSTMTQLGENRDDHGISTQTWQEVPSDQPLDDVVGRPLQHVAAEKQVTGEAKYLDDIPPYNNELYLCLVMSSRAHAHVRDVNVDLAVTSPGFVTYVDYRDVPGTNNLGNFERVFAEDKVTCVGHVIGAVVADTHAHAQRAAKLVRIDYEDILPRIITIEDAIEHNSFYDPIKFIKSGDAEGIAKSCDHVLEGEFRMAGQEHFYLETQACLAVPKGEDGEMDIFCSCQSPNILQTGAATILGVESNKINVRVKRMGGGFGGKETRFNVIANPVIIAAHKCGKPVRCMLTRQEDMLITGGRHPFLFKYKVGFANDGRIHSYISDLFCNAGNSLDLSLAVMDKALFHADNCYRMPNTTLRGFTCRTNVASNTAFRGFGGPQGCLLIEECISRIAAILNMSPERVRETNMYRDGDVTHFGQKLDSFYATRCWQECLQRSKFDERREKVEIYNKTHRWRKRGLACVPTKFGIGYYVPFLNQSGALVHIYKDGSVLLTHGGTEMGQGLHTKMIQIASRCLGVPKNRIHISETSTNTVPNTPPTAASISSDLNGMAVKEACQKIMVRLKPLKTENPKLTWDELIMKAFVDCVSLSATGHYKVPNLDFTWDNKTGRVEGRSHNYFTYGAAVSEVEIDCLTGDHIVLQTDIVMDVGKSLNPTIDIGQIEGAFTQGYGLLTLEEPLHTPKGDLLTRGPGAYKIPGFGDCPKQFNVHLLRSSVNKRAIFSSKAVGEPPLFLASSVFFAIKDAVGSARKDSGLVGDFRMDAPASSERIRMICGDKFTKQHSKHVDEAEERNRVPWSIQA